MSYARSRTPSSSLSRTLRKVALVYMPRISIRPLKKVINVVVCVCRMCQRERHACRKTCSEDCGNCLELVLRTLPCGHSIKLECFIDEKKYPCDEIIDDVLPLCKHAIKRKCHKNPEEVACSHPCEDRLDCGHACTQNCHKTRDPDHLHVSEASIIKLV